MSIAVLTTYVLVVLGLMVIPGPATLLVLARSVSGGRRAGIATGLGIAAGDLIHSTMATFGLSALLATSALAFEVVKYIGVAYLIYLGYRAFIEKSGNLDMTAAPEISPGKAFPAGDIHRDPEPEDGAVLPRLPAAVHPSRKRFGDRAIRAARHHLRGVQHRRDLGARDRRRLGARLARTGTGRSAAGGEGDRLDLYGAGVRLAFQQQ